MSAFRTYWKKENAERWMCLWSAIVLPTTLIGLGVILENVLRTVSRVDTWILSFYKSIQIRM